MIDVLIPVLARPHRVEPLLENITSSTKVALRVIFLCSTGDAKEIEAVERSGAEYLLFDGPPANGQYAKKINLGYRSSKHPWLLLGADDLRFHSGWAEAALRKASTRHHVVSMNDKANAFVRQGILATHSLVRRSYIDEKGCSLDGPGIVYHEGYSHNFVDCELSVIARQRGVFVYASDAVLEHLHPVFGKGKHDAVYELGTADFRSDRDLFCNRMRRTYPRDQLVRRYLNAAGRRR